MNFSSPSIFFDFNRISRFCGKNGAIIVDQNVIGFSKELQKITNYPVIPFEALEENKSRKTQLALEDQLFQLGLGLDATLIALGGGITLDLVGFIASEYMRGISFLSIPTTLLSMCDAAHGGKTGINTPFGKNLIGSFYLPKAIFIHQGFLKTLPKIEWLNGFSEILKMGLIRSKELWDQIIHMSDSFESPKTTLNVWMDQWEQEIHEIISTSIALKWEIVQADFRETLKLRRILNFGHTVAHAMEKMSHYQLPHGQAVALGCMAESFISFKEGHLDIASFHAILDGYRKFSWTYPTFHKESFLSALCFDKKQLLGKPRFCMIEAIGKAHDLGKEYCSTLSQERLNELTHWIDEAQYQSQPQPH